MRIAGGRFSIVPRARVTGKHGFSLVELMVTLTVAAILLGIGIPSFSTLITNQRLGTAASDFLNAINLARSEAIQRSARVDLVPADGRNWKSGWVVFIDGNGNLHPDPSEPVIFSHGPVPDSMEVESNLTDDAVRYIAYTSTGRTRTNSNGQQPQAGTVTFSLDNRVRKIKINFLGRARVCNPQDEPSSC